jgi:TatD DNase family protein
MLIDSHCHLDQLDLTPYEGKLEGALANANRHGVSHFLCVCIDLVHFADVLKIAEQYDNIYASVGLHPNEVVPHDPSIEELIKLAQHPKVIAIGETGLDYYRTEGDVSWQQERFRRHIRAALQVKKPLIVHSRQAREDTIRILREEGADKIGGVMHCFTENWAMAQQAMAMNFYISFSGIVTFKNAKELQEVAKQVPLEKMLVETDSPYLAPNPYRGKPNEPAYVRYVAEYIAELKQLDFAAVAEQTTKNFFSLFPSTSSSNE